MQLNKNERNAWSTSTKFNTNPSDTSETTYKSKYYYYLTIEPARCRPIDYNATLPTCPNYNSVLHNK